MRITNKMMTNNALYNINNNKNLMDNLANQYSTGKKINRPSDDPIVAVRALKLRTNVSELNQYVGKNIPDAFNWMEVTEGSLKVINSVISSMNTYCNQGANETLTADDRDKIVANLNQYVNQIYQEGSTNYAGRYVFSGFKTNTPLIFNEGTERYDYSITEPLDPKNIQTLSVVNASKDMKDLDLNNLAAWDDTMPHTDNVYRITVSYRELSEGYFDGTTPKNVSLGFTDAAGNVHALSSDAGTINIKSVVDEDAYSVGPMDVNFIPETGEFIIGDDMKELMEKGSGISCNYSKDTFRENDLRPEHYFDCVAYDKELNEAITYTKENQEIKYEVNYNQKLTINTQGADAFSNVLGRMVAEITDAVKEVTEVEEKITQLDKKLADTSLSVEQKNKLEEIKEQLKSEYTLKTDLMTKAFQRGLSVTESEQENVNVALADLGGRYKRLQLIESRLEDQTTDTTELLSKNEDADLTDTIVKYSSADTVYNASLSAAAKLVQSSLLDYLR